MAGSSVVDTSLIELLFLLLFVFFLSAAELQQYYDRRIAENQTAAGQQQPDRVDSLEAKVDSLGDLVARAPGAFSCFSKTRDGSKEYPSIFTIKSGRKGYRVTATWPQQHSSEIRSIASIAEFNQSGWMSETEFEEWGENLLSVLDDPAHAGNPFDVSCRLHVTHKWAEDIVRGTEGDMVVTDEDLAREQFLTIQRFFYHATSESRQILFR